MVINRSEVVDRPLAAMLANDGAKLCNFDMESTCLFVRGELPHVLEGETLESQARSADVVILGVPSNSTS